MLSKRLVTNGQNPEDSKFVMAASPSMEVERALGIDAAYNYILKKQTVAMFPGVVAGLFLLIGIGIGYAFCHFANI